MKKKYVLTDKIKIVDEHILHRIRALIDFSDVRVGDLGGYVESEDNLSHDDNCWVYNNACVYENARVYDNAQIHNNAKVYGNAKVYESAFIIGNPKIHGDAKIYDSQCINYGTVTTDILATKNWKVMLKCLNKKIKIKNNKAILYEDIYKTRNKNIFISRNYVPDIIFEKNKINYFSKITPFYDSSLINFCAKCEIDLNDIIIIKNCQIYYKKLKVLDIMNGGDINK